MRFITRVADARAGEGGARPEAEGRRAGADRVRPGAARRDDQAAGSRRCERRRTALDFEAAARLRDQLFELKAKRDATPRRRDAFAAIRASQVSQRPRGRRPEARATCRVRSRVPIRDSPIPPLDDSRFTIHELRDVGRGSSAGSRAAGRSSRSKATSARERPRSCRRSAAVWDSGRGDQPDVRARAPVSGRRSDRLPPRSLPLERRTSSTNSAGTRSSAATDWCSIEWPERAGDRLPPEHVTPLRLEHIPGDDTDRRLLRCGLARVLVLALDASTYAGSWR